MYDLIRQMHDKFAIPDDTSTRNMLFRLVAMQEELAEFGSAVLKKDRVAQLDSLIDLVVFAFGTATQLGFSAEQFEGAFAEVMRANMSKKPVYKAKDSKRGSELDLIKPEGWVPPDLTPWVK